MMTSKQATRALLCGGLGYLVYGIVRTMRNNRKETSEDVDEDDSM